MTLDPRNPKPGVYREVPFGVYRAIRAANASSVSRKSGWHMAAAMANGEGDTAATRRGHLVHTAVFEPHLLKSVYKVNPWPDYKKKAAQEWRDAVIADGGCPVSAAELGDGVNLAAIVWADQYAASVLRGNEYELTLVWRCAATGVLCKARVDSWNARSVVASDLKTGRDASLERWPKAVETYDYHVQAAWYCWGLVSLGLADLAELQFVWVVIESEFPHFVQVHICGPELLRIGSETAMAALAAYAEWLKQPQPTARYGPPAECGPTTWLRRRRIMAGQGVDE